MSASTPLFILYGSATGNSEHIAKALATSLPKSNPALYTSIITCEGNAFRSKCIGYWNREPSLGKYPVLIITSTTGNADAPENIGRFIRYLKRKENIDKQPLKHVCYAVLGLGDTNYDNFCATAKIADKKMKELGGMQAIKLACADEATGLEDTVEPWQDHIIKHLITSCACGQNGVSRDDNHDIKDEIILTEPSQSQSQSQSQKITEKKEEPQDSTNEAEADAIQSLIALSESLHISMPSTIPESSLPSLLPHTHVPSNTLLVEQEGQRPRAPSFSTQSSTSSCQYNFTNPYLSPILSKRYLTNTTIPDSIHSISSLQTHFKSNNDKDIKRVLELTIGLPDDLIPLDFFQPGDSIGVTVDNRYTIEYSTLMSLFQTRGHDVKQDQIHQKSIQDSFLNLDITSPVKKRILLHLSQVCTNATECYYLKLLSSKLGSALYDSFIVEQQRNIVDILMEFPSCTASPQYLHDLCHDIAPRYYSVCSSPYEVNKLCIALSIVDYTINNKRKHGLASTYLELISNQNNQGHVQIFPKPPSSESTFRLPSNTSKPMIFIGPGTGIAPFLGFLKHLQRLDELQYQREQDCNEGNWRGMDIQHEEDQQIKVIKKDIYVYFGCRWSSHDYIYKSELESFHKDGYVTKLHTAFSRDGHDKIYVQDLIQKNQHEITNLVLEKDAYIYICGDGKMAKDVQACLLDVCKKDESFLVDLKNKRKLVLDVWS